MLYRSDGNKNVRDIKQNDGNQMGSAGFNIDAFVGARLLKKRYDLRLSKVELSAIFSISVESLDQYECGSKRLPAPLILELCNVLGVGVVYFFPSEGE